MILRRLPTGEWQAQQAICDVLKDIGTAKSLRQLNALAQNGKSFVKPHARIAARAIRNRNP